MRKLSKTQVFGILAFCIVLLTACGAAGAANPKTEAESIDKVILDCDMGYMNDDALALSMLLQAEKKGTFDLIGITLTGGNTLIDAEFELNGETYKPGWICTGEFLKAAGRTDIPVFRGTDYPAGYTAENIPDLAKFYRELEYLEYGDGYGAIQAYEKVPSGSLINEDAAADFLVEQAKKYPGQLVIIATGPTMNLARAIEKDPAFAGNVKAVYYMGGALGEEYEAVTNKGNTVNAIGGANVTPYAEYNVLYDPLSLYTCLTAGFPKQVLCPGELNIEIENNIVEKLEAGAGKNRIAELWHTWYSAGIPEYPYWDPLTAFAFLYPEKVEQAEEVYVTVNTGRQDPRFGQTSEVTGEIHNNMQEKEKASYGKATVIRKVSGFWDTAIPLLCGE